MKGDVNRGRDDLTPWDDGFVPVKGRGGGMWKCDEKKKKSIGGPCFPATCRAIES